MTVSQLVAQFLIAIGGLLILLAGIGVYRFPGVLTRANAATKATGLGLAAVLAGAALEIGTTRAYVTLGAAVIMQFATAPVSGHIIGRAAYRSGTALWVGTHTDDLAGYYRSRYEAPDQTELTGPPEHD
jgi:multicomponent Na+:H+ antiporter subunit G